MVPEAFDFWSMHACSYIQILYFVYVISYKPSFQIRCSYGKGELSRFCK